MMTDEELIAWLRDWMEHDEGKINDAREAAADRIESLTRDSKLQAVLLEDAYNRIEELIVERDTAREYAGEVRIREKVADDARIKAEAKLAKAVELLEEIEVRLTPISGFFFDTFPRREIKAIVAEIKGESHE